jgi:hypothetical protein
LRIVGLPPHLGIKLILVIVVVRQRRMDLSQRQMGVLQVDFGRLNP